MRYPQLDERLQAAADLFTACDFGADIGADHGRLSCYLLHSEKCRKMLVSDVSVDSLDKARRLMKLHQLEERAVFRVANGLEALRGMEGTIQCAAICGMGGQLISKILLSAHGLLGGAALVLSSHTDIPLVRKTLTEIGYHVAQERIVRAKGRFYVLMRAESGSAAYSEKELYLGPCLLKSKPPLWQQYLTWREGVVACEQGHETQLTWIREELVDETGNRTDGV